MTFHVYTAPSLHQPVDIRATQCRPIYRPDVTQPDKKSHRLIVGLAVPPHQNTGPIQPACTLDSSKTRGRGAKREEMKADRKKDSARAATTSTATPGSDDGGTGHRQPRMVRGVRRPCRGAASPATRVAEARNTLTRTSRSKAGRRSRSTTCLTPPTRAVAHDPRNPRPRGPPRSLPDTDVGAHSRPPIARLHLPTPPTEWRTFTAALRAAVRDDGTVHACDVRPLVRGRIEPKHIGESWRRARNEGLLVEVGTTLRRRPGPQPRAHGALLRAEDSRMTTNPAQAFADAERERRRNLGILGVPQPPRDEDES